MYLMQTLLPSRILSKDLKIKIYHINNNITSSALCLWNTFYYIKQGMQSMDIRKPEPKAIIWAQKWWELGWRKLKNEESRNFYSSPNIVRAIKSRRLSWEGT
jgi:hypothetical protein